MHKVAEMMDQIQNHIQNGVDNRRGLFSVSLLRIPMSAGLRYVSEHVVHYGDWTMPKSELAGTGCSSEIDATTLWIVSSREVE